MFNRFRSWLNRKSAPQPTAAPLPKDVHEALAARLASWSPRITPGVQPLADQAVVVLDLETTGLDLKHDTVLSVGAVRLVQGGISLGETFERVMNVQVQLNPTSQLFHGLTMADLAGGDDPRVVLLDLLEWGQDAVWLAWHAWFDEAMLAGAARHWLGVEAARMPRVLDLAHAMPLLFPQHAALGADLDRWLAAMQLDNSARHHAVADAMATAELALMALSKAQALGWRTWAELAAAMAESQKALARAQQASQAGF